jgi:hypothetical protein
MSNLRPSDIAGTREFLLSHVDPLFAIEVADRAAHQPGIATHPNMVLFGSGVVPPLQPMLRELVGGALDEAFVNDLCDVLEHSRVHLDLAGLRVLRGLSSRLTVTEPPPPHDRSGSGAVAAPDAVCDLLIQPLMAFCSLYVDLSAEWVKLAEDPELTKQVFYRTNQSSYFEARLENLIRRALGLATEFSESYIVNIP